MAGTFYDLVKIVLTKIYGRLLLGKRRCFWETFSGRRIERLDSVSLVKLRRTPAQSRWTLLAIATALAQGEGAELVDAIQFLRYAVHQDCPDAIFK